MKKFIAKASKPFALPLGSRSSTSNIPSGTQPSGLSNPNLTHAAGLPPKDVVPAVPHPCPHGHLALLVTKDGLLIRPHVYGYKSKSGPYSYARIGWGKTHKIEEMESSEDLALEWDDSVVIYGIVGILELFSCVWCTVRILLILRSSRFIKVLTYWSSPLGQKLAMVSFTIVLNYWVVTPLFFAVIDPRNAVYGVKGVLDIPLLEDRARMALNTLAARNIALTRPSLLPKRQETDISVDIDDDPASRDGPRVKFLSNPAVKWIRESTSTSSNNEIGRSIPRPSSAQSSGSDVSNPSSDVSEAASPVFKTIATRLSFWSRMSKRTPQTPLSPEFPVSPTTTIPEPLSLREEAEILDKLMHESKEERAEVIENILSSTAPPPATAEERHSEMETKIVRECIREFTKGGMYFAYNFGMTYPVRSMIYDILTCTKDVTRSLQHKQEQVLKFQKEHDLLAGLGALPSPENKDEDHPSDPISVSPLAEPNSAFPLWRRVDKQFWWNEWMSKPLIDAGVGHLLRSLFTS